MAGTALSEQQSQTGCKGDSDDKARRRSGGNGDSSVSDVNVPEAELTELRRRINATQVA